MLLFLTSNRVSAIQNPFSRVCSIISALAMAFSRVANVCDCIEVHVDRVGAA